VGWLALAGVLGFALMAARLLEAVLGVWLMLAPALFEYGPPAAHDDRIVGPLVASVGLIAAWEIARPLRFVNLLLGAWLVIAPLVLGFGGAASANSVAAGLAVATLSLFGGRSRARFGGGWGSLWPPLRAAGKAQRAVFEDPARPPPVDDADGRGA
jgi:hypothetical protein